ncbi:MAG TPA: response regulator transcription factor [Chloroflexi bacterium]|nr:response regulator transcription factor [Chloroflexota bacterium]
MIRIVLADDHAILRSGLRLLIDSQPDMTVVGEAADGAQTLEQVEIHQPDLVLLDLSMPGLGGLESLPLIRQRSPETRALILTMHDDEGYLRQALRAGAAGYVLKKAVDSELLDAIRAVGRGETYIHPAMTRLLLSGMLPEPATTQEAINPWQALSEREFDVLRLVALGHTNAEIAERLSLSVKTVETYRARGMDKLGLETRAQLVRSALTYGLLD